MRRMRDEKKAVFLQVKRCNDGAFEITPPDNIVIRDGMDLTLYAKPVDGTSRVTRFTVGTGKAKKGSQKRVTLKLAQRDGRIQLNDRLQYYVRVPKKKGILSERLMKVLLPRSTDEE